MTGKKIVRSVAAVALALSIIFAGSVSGVPASATSISDLQKQQAQLKDKQQQIASELDKLKNDKSQKLQYKEQLDAQIQDVQSQIDNLNSQIAALDADITTKKSQIASKQKDIDANLNKLKDRLRALYLTGEASNIEIILNAKNIMDLADKTEIVKVITEHDTNLINTLNTEMESVKTQEAQIESNRKAVASAKLEYDQKRKDLAALEDENNQVLAQLSADEKDKAAESAKTAAEQKKLDQAIDDWFTSYYESLRRKNGGGSGGGNSGGGSGGGSGGYVSTGNFTWPVPSCYSMSRGFGDTSTGSPHKGIDIAGAGIYGAPIVAADSGRVVMAGFGNYGGGYGGYGNVVVIDHGGGYSTLYAHMSSIAVGSGAQVTKGQTIGYVGSTGDSTGPHCHFEIRVDGVAKNPMNWFG